MSIEINDNNFNLEVERMVIHYRNTKSFNPNMYSEAMWQYADMANGGNGGLIDYDGTKSIRSEYYATHPDSFFFEVLSCLGEFERYIKSQNKPIGIP